MTLENSSILFQLGALLGLLALNAFFVAVEFAYVTVPRPRIDQLVQKGDARARRVQHLLSDTDRVLATSQMGITIASLGLGWFGENAANEFLRFLFKTLPADFDNAISRTIGILIAFGAITAFHIVLGEQAPKVLAINAADRFALFSGRIVMLFGQVMRPFVWFLDKATTSVARLFGAKSVGAHQTIYTEDELKQLVSETHESGEITTREKEMIHKVFEFGDLRVAEVMTPRPSLISLDQNTSVEKFLETFLEHAHARFPIFSNNGDNIIGFLGVKDVLQAFASKGAGALSMTIGTIARPAMFVPETNRVAQLFADMQTQKIQVAIVIDEFGGTAGMVTLEHLTEQIVGRLGDELAQEQPRIIPLDDQTTDFDAQMRVEEANEILGVSLPVNDDYETVSGFVLYTLRRVPKEGDQLRRGNLRITVTRMEGPKIKRVTVTRQ